MSSSRLAAFCSILQIVGFLLILMLVLVGQPQEGLHKTLLYAFIALTGLAAIGKLFFAKEDRLLHAASAAAGVGIFVIFGGMAAGLS